MEAEWFVFLEIYQALFEELPSSERLKILTHPRSLEAADLALEALSTCKKTSPNRSRRELKKDPSGR
jgi:hypothetical protein